MNAATRQVMFSSESVEWETPEEFFKRYHNAHDFQLDVCANAINTKTPLYISLQMNAFTTPWTVDYSKTGAPARCWMNPPYGNAEHVCKNPATCKKKICAKRGSHCTVYKPGVEDWVKLAYSWSQKGCLVVCLLPARTDTAWFKDYAERRGEVEFVRGRLSFSDHGTAPFPSIVVVFRPRRELMVTATRFTRDQDATIPWDEVICVTPTEDTSYACDDCNGADGVHEPQCIYSQEWP